MKKGIVNTDKEPISPGRPDGKPFLTPSSHNRPAKARWPGAGMRKTGSGKATGMENNQRNTLLKAQTLKEHIDCC